jgi:phosphoribosyl-ATP pyrophosphohydrolase/phosphoribosyl-AMP cyclohydrolase
MTDIAFLERLEAIVRDRISQSPDASYTARLAEQGVLAAAQKLGEEGVELALAAAAQTDEAVRNEAADLLFHLLVVLVLRDVPLASVVSTLADRHRQRSAR